MTQNTNTIDLAQFKNAVGFTMTCRKWGNRRQGNMATVECNSDKSRLKLTKQLIKSPEYDEIVSYMGELTRWIYTRTVPSFFKDGFQLTTLAGVAPVNERMANVPAELSALVEKLVAAFPGQVDEARIQLQDQFRATDYPLPEQLRELFSVTYNWITFTVPEGLPPELRASEESKLKQQFADAGVEITQALRVAFADLITHASDRLKSDPGEKKKIFRDSMLGNIQEFIDTFSQRNLLNDSALANLVERAKTVLVGMSAEKLRTSEDIRELTRTSFQDIKATLDKLITEKPVRKFDFTE